MKKLELLAPVKDLECGMAAIDCGADAVYVGAPQFGARESAGNDLSDIEALIKYAHKYWAKVYVTVNTLLRNDDIPQAVKLIHELYHIGADAIIIQDVGLLECELPPIPIIASTQMHNNTPERVAFLGKVGVKRAILARELDLEQILAIRAATDMELECFVHGSLCVCYSGQCYMSYALGSRSGNRGQCAQPCRKLYDLIDSSGKPIVSGKHLLSLKDLNLSENLSELVEAGVTSFKIEGRLKDKAYVTNVVSSYRQKLDEIMAQKGMLKSSSGKSTVGFVPDVNKTFNRGYTKHFLHGRGAKVGSPDTPKMIGEEVGRVYGMRGRSIIVDTKLSMHRGDGICFYNRGGELRGTLVNDVKGPMLVVDKTNGIVEGTIIYRNHDHEFLTTLEKARLERRISATMTLTAEPNTLVLTAVDEDGNTARATMPYEETKADNQELALKNIKTQLAKTGDTEFKCDEVVVDLPELYFIPISALNSLRRGVLENLAVARIENRPMEKGGAVVNETPFPEKKLSYLGNVLNRKAADFYRRHGVTEIEPAPEAGVDMLCKKIMTTKYCLKHQLGMCHSKGNSKAPEDHLTLVDEEGHRLGLRFDCAKCVMEVHLQSSGRITQIPPGSRK